MCGRFTVQSSPDRLARFLEVEEIVAPDLGARYNVAPTDEVYAVATGDSRRRLGTFRWGLVPWWADSPAVGSRMINARAETVAERKGFREAFERRRCLIPADGFYEWRKEPDGRRQPFHIRRRDRQPLAFAGLWERWRDPADPNRRLATCAIVTTRANAVVVPVHDRMPVVLPASGWEAWLDPDNHDLATLRGLLAPTADDLLVMTAVQPLVNDVRNDGPELLEPMVMSEEPED